MVAICSTSAMRSFGGFHSTSIGTLRQSSLRSITSTHSRDCLIKHNISDTCNNQRRVRFASATNCDDFSESLDLESVFEFDVVDPLEPLYLTPSEILKIRSEARVQASHFAQVYPNVTAEINSLFENGGSALNICSQVKRLRSRRPRLDPYEIALDDMDRDDVFLEPNDFIADDQSDRQDCNDETLDDTNYFCTMRGLESRISPVFRLNRRVTIRKVINLQTEMKKSGCCATQIQMGLRAVSAQASQRARTFARYQAALDECEVYNV